MNLKYNQLATHNDQHSKVRAMLNDTYNYDLSTTPEPTITTKIEPLPKNMRFNRSTIRKNHFKKKITEEKEDEALETFDTIKRYIPDDRSQLPQPTRKNYEEILNCTKNIAFNGNPKAQQSLTTNIIEKFYPFLDHPEHFTNTKDVNHGYALELLDFTQTLRNNNIPFAITKEMKKQLIDLRDKTDPVTSHLIRTILYLQNPTDTRLNFVTEHHCPENPEIEATCQLLIDNGNISVKDALDTVTTKNKPANPKNNNKIKPKAFKTYITNTEISSKQEVNDLASKQISDLEELFKTDKKNKDEIAYLVALKSQEIGDLLKAYNYQGMLSPSTPYAKQLTKGIFSHDKKNQKLVLHALELLEANKKGPKSSTTQAVCHFLLNELSPQSFIEYITSHKDIPRTLSAIIHSPLGSEVIHKLHTNSLEKNDPLFSLINWITAELDYLNANYDTAHTYYVKTNIPYLKEKKAQDNAFNACIASTEIFNKKELDYLSALSGNIHNQLKKLDKTNPKFSCNVGLLAQTLVKNNPKMNMADKKEIIFNALDHLEYAQKNGALDKKSLTMLYDTATEFHTLLSALYQDQNDNFTSLKHARHALEYRSLATNNKQNDAVLSILACAEKNNPELYRTYAPYINTILKYIDNTHKNSNQQHNYVELSKFVSSGLYEPFLPYCEHAYAQNKQSSDDILFLMALTHKNKGNYDKACKCIDAVSPAALCDDILLLIKAAMYAGADRTLPNTELEKVLTLLSNKKKPSLDEQKTILSLTTSSNDFFIQTKNYALALKLITQLTKLQKPTVATIQLTYNITSHFIDTNNPYVTLTQWQKELDTCHFYDKIDMPTCYDSSTNACIGYLLFNRQEATPNYEKIIAYFSAALDNEKELLLETAADIKKTCGTLYYNWAVSMIDDRKTFDKKTFLRLLDIAINKYDSSIAKYKKGLFILNQSDDKNLIKHALQLLEENIQNNSPEEALSRLTKAHIYLGCTDNPAVRKYISPNIEKALTYLNQHNNNKELLICLAKVYNGSRLSNFNEHIQNKYINRTKASEYINFLMKTNDKSRELLNIKLALLLEGTPTDKDYDQALECYKQIRSYKDYTITEFNALPIFHQRTQHLITHKIMTEEAIKWCCYAADSQISTDFLKPSLDKTTPEQEKLAHYLLSAAKGNNLNAQLLIIPYLHAINYSTNDIHYHRALGYAHTALINPHATKQTHHTLLKNILLEFTKNGRAVPYFMLCHYHSLQKDKKGLEQTLLTFSQAPQQFHPTDDTTNTIKKICISCKDTLQPYVERCMSNKNKNKKTSLIDTLATYTKACLLAQSDDQVELTLATLLFRITIEILEDTFKLKHFVPSAQTLMSNIKYKRAFIEKENGNTTVDIGLMRESARLGHLPAIHFMAKKAINDHKNQISHDPITFNDFLPALRRHVETSEPCNPESLELLGECIKIQAELNEGNPQAKPQKKSDLISPPNPRKNLVKNQNPEMCTDLFAAMYESSEGDKMKAYDLLLDAAINQNNPSAYMMIASSYFKAENEAKQIDKKYSSEFFLLAALTNGLQERQFCDNNFLNRVCYHINQIVTKESKSDVKKHLLSSIKNILIHSEINLTDFCAVVLEETNLDLSLVPEWNS
jgi:hypothetical protein